MKVSDLVLCEQFEVVTLPDKDREIDGVYVGDLLSWVMGRAQSGNAWITIMSNLKNNYIKKRLPLIRNKRFGAYKKANS